MSARFDGQRDFVQMSLHCVGVALGQDEASSLAFGGADGTEDVGGLGTLILGRTRPGATSRPAPGDLGLLADASLVLPPDFYLGALWQARLERRQRQKAPGLLGVL